MENFDHLNTEKIMAMASRLGIGKGDAAKEEAIRQAAEKLSGKNDEELIKEVKKLKATLGDDMEKFKKQLNAVKAVRGMLNKEQRSKFDEMIKILEEE